MSDLDTIKGAGRAGLLNEKEAAAMLGCTASLLRKFRLHRKGPPYYLIGRLVRYSEADLSEFIKAQRVEVTRQEAA
jgi:hypothetical protein